MRWRMGEVEGGCVEGGCGGGWVAVEGGLRSTSLWARARGVRECSEQGMQGDGMHCGGQGDSTQRLRGRAARTVLKGVDVRPLSLMGNP